MKTVEFGKKEGRTVMLLHGGGLSWWNYRETAALLQDAFHIILPVLDGHAGSDRPFTTIEDNARELIRFVDEKLNGRADLIGGLSLGGLILLEALSQRRDLCQYALVESALALPMPLTRRLIGPACALSYNLIRREWFARLQFASLGIQPALFEDYYRDTCLIDKDSMTAMLRANADYSLKEGLTISRARTTILLGSGERPAMKKSARQIQKQIPGSTMHIIKGYKHGEMSLNHPAEYAQLIRNMLNPA